VSELEDKCAHDLSIFFGCCFGICYARHFLEIVVFPSRVLCGCFWICKTPRDFNPQIWSWRELFLGVFSAVGSIVVVEGAAGAPMAAW